MLFAANRVVCFSTARSKLVLDKHTDEIARFSSENDRTDISAYRADLLAFLNGNVVEHAALCRCVDFLCEVLDGMDAATDTVRTELRATCEFLLTKLTNAGIWGGGDEDGDGAWMAYSA